MTTNDKTTPARTRGGLEKQARKPLEVGDKVYILSSYCEVVPMRVAFVQSGIVSLHVPGSEWRRTTRDKGDVYRTRAEAEIVLFSGQLKQERADERDLARRLSHATAECARLEARLARAKAKAKVTK